MKCMYKCNFSLKSYILKWAADRAQKYQFRQDKKRE